jgi:hypothetical protein
VAARLPPVHGAAALPPPGSGGGLRATATRKWPHNGFRCGAVAAIKMSG